VVLPFPDQLAAQLKRCGLTLREFGARVDLSHTSIRKFRNGTLRPPLDQVDRWADAFGLSGDERAEFLLSAQMAHCPPPLADLVADLQRRLADCQEREAKRVAERDEPYQSPVSRSKTRPKR
jgi:transcriptional regulator with XRE-family HTH domain